MLALTGGALGIVPQLVMPEYKELDWLTAFAMGIVSGFVSVGAYQVVHQYKSWENNKKWVKERDSFTRFFFDK